MNLKMKRLLLVFLSQVAIMGFATNLATAQQKDENVKFAAGLPGPTGKFPIGLRRFVWVDQTRNLSADRRRMVVVSIFYPSDEHSRHYAEYVFGASQLPVNDQTAALREVFGSAWGLIASDKIRSEAIENAAIVQARSKLPVLLFSPGLGMPAAAYSVQLADLASHGYVVVGIDHPNDSPLLILSDGSFIPFDRKTWSEQQPPGPPTADGMKFGVLRQKDWIEDSVFVLQQLHSQSNASFFSALDLTRVGAFGHSMGGVVAARLCQTNSQVEACMDEDGELFGHTLKPGEVIPALDPALALKKPLLIMSLVEPSMKAIPEYMQVREANRTELVRFLSTQTSQSYLTAIDHPDMGHISFADTSLLYEDAKRARALQLSEYTRNVAIAFFDRFLMGGTTEELSKALSDNKIGTVTKFPR
jgi:pimeloyl-ACP methyl ester carboxylesterase